LRSASGNRRQSMLLSNSAAIVIAHPPNQGGERCVLEVYMWRENEN
jgi:hypothetical protein